MDGCAHYIKYVQEGEASEPRWGGGARCGACTGRLGILKLQYRTLDLVLSPGIFSAIVAVPSTSRARIPFSGATWQPTIRGGHDQHVPVHKCPFVTPPYSHVLNAELCRTVPISCLSSTACCCTEVQYYIRPSGIASGVVLHTARTRRGLCLTALFGSTCSSASTSCAPISYAGCALFDTQSE